MEFWLFKSAGWQLIAQMDWMATVIILGLFFLSVICIAIIAFKALAFIKHQQELKRLQRQLRSINNFNEVVTLARKKTSHTAGRLLARSLDDLEKIMRAKGEKTLTEKEFEKLDFMVNQTVSNLLVEEEAYLPLLSSSAVVSPLIGLFGTIWGLVQAFIDIGQEKTADIATIAPGIAMALLTTLAGLIVAIPAMAAFHYFSNELRKIEAGLYDVSDSFLQAARDAFVK